MTINILSVSDTEIGLIYSPQILDKFGDIDLVISCGDLPHSYLEYIISMLDVPLYFVHGNHSSPEYGMGFVRHQPGGGIDLHRRCERHYSGLLLAGVEGCQRYNNGPYQYSQSEMWTNVWSLVPRLLLNRIPYGRYLDVFVSHAAPWGIQDCDDLPHQGIKAYRWLIKVFQPVLHLHGHIHIYRRDAITCTQEKNTIVVNSFGYRCLRAEWVEGRCQVSVLR